MIDRRAAVLSALAAAGLPARAQTPPQAPSPKTDGMDAMAFAAHIEAVCADGGPIDAGLAEMAASGLLSGAVLVGLDGRPVFRKAYGVADMAKGVPNTPQTRFCLASCNKMFTAVAIGRLLERGRLGLDDKLSAHLPDFPREIADRVTIAQLLSHTSGLGSYWGDPGYPAIKDIARTVAEYVRVVRDEALAFEPGAQYAYSNSGYVLLGAVIEKLTGRDYYEVVDEQVYRPAGMTRSGHDLRDRTAPGTAVGYTNGCFARPDCEPGAWTDARSAWGRRGTPAGGGYSTVDDLSNFAVALKAGRLLKPATASLFMARHASIGRPGGPHDGYGYGFGDKLVKGLRVVGHSGGTPGATAQLDMYVTRPLTMVVLTNRDAAQRQVLGLLRRELI